MNEGKVTSCPTLLHSARVRKLALCSTVLAGLLTPSFAWAANPPVITVAEPEGFSDLTGERRVLVDVYFGGMHRGEAQIVTAPGLVTFVNPAAVVALLPDLTDRAVVEAVLARGPVAANASRVCAEGADRSRCGSLEPTTVGVIYDRERFRLEIFLNPQLLVVHENVEEYLPPAQRGLSLINSIGAVFSGRSDSGNENYNVVNQLVLAHGERRLRADLTYANDLGLAAERIALEWDRPGRRYSLGALWTPGSEIAGRRKLIGFGLESQIDTRLDRDEILGSPVIAYLDQRGRVDVLRDGRVYSSAIYEAGNQQIDTSNLPDGSYEIVLRIEQPGRQAREERRFYTKSRRLPSNGRTDFFAYGGLLVEDAYLGSLEPSGHPYLQGGIAHRINESWALGGAIDANDDTASAEIAATFLTPKLQVRAAAVADLDGAYGAILQLSSSGTSRLNFNFDLRHIEISDAFSVSSTMPPGLSSANRGLLDAAGSGGSYSQLGGIVSFSLANFRFLGSLFYRDDEAQRARYSIGPSLEWDVLRKGHLTVTLRGEVVATERGGSGFAGVSLRLLGANSSITALGGARASDMTGDDLGEGPVAALSGSWNAEVAGANLALGAGVEHQPRQDDVILSTEFRHPYGSFAGDVVRSDGPLAQVTQYSAGFQTALVAGAGSVRVAGRTTTESMLIARVEGARSSDRFEVLVNEQVAGTIVGNSPTTLALPAYRAYDVRIRPTGDGLLAYDSSARRIGLYPGSVARLDWRAAPITIKFGRLILPDGAPVRGASIMGQGVWSETDSEGYFQIEVPDDAELAVTLQDGRSYTMTLPEGEAEAGLAHIGSIVCCTEDNIRLGALELGVNLRDGGSQ